MVKKANEKWRMCVNFTDLNDACPKDYFPLPRIDTLIDATAGHEKLSFMYGFSEYNQIKVHKDDIPKISFITDFGVFCYLVMVFGLKNAGATYQRLVNKIFKGLIGKTMEVYVNDMLVKSLLSADHITHLREAFEVLRYHKMMLNLAKCAFRQTKMNEAEMIQASSFHSEREADELELQWAAFERLPTMKRVRMSLFDNLQDNDDQGKTNKKVMKDVAKLSAAEKHVFIDKLISNVQEDNARLLLKMKQRMDRVGLTLPAVEVRFRNVNVEAKCEVVHGKPLPTLWNTFKSIFSVVRLSWCKSQVARVHIIKGVSGTIRPSRMTLLLGPPGCGKTTLLKALAGKLDKSLKVDGEVTYNGTRVENLRPQEHAAYISQYNFHVPEMTVRETIDFSARCQGVESRKELLAEVSRREKQAGYIPEADVDAYMKAISINGLEKTLQTDYILKILGLETCADTFVGSVMRRGISGGQKRRLATGEMIVSTRRVLFMDEISNGLDSSTTFQIVTCLQQLVHITDATALISLLQPAPETFDLFDDIVLIAEGKIVYHGARADVLKFFESFGFRYVTVDEFSKKPEMSHLDGKIWLHDELPSTAEESKRDKNLPQKDKNNKYSMTKWQLFKACMDREVLLTRRNISTNVIKSTQVTSGNLTIGEEALSNNGLNFKSYYYWISVGVLFGFTLVYNAGFVLALTYLKSPGTARAIISYDKLRELQQDQDCKDEGKRDNRIHMSPQLHSMEYNVVPEIQEPKKTVLPFEPLTLTFENVQYFVDTPLEMRKKGFKDKRIQLIHNMTGVFRPGILTALMGVTGAGKTTLLDVLSGRKDSGHTEGDIRIGGSPRVQHTFARVSGYCEQSDIHSPHITVEESVAFSAFLRLPSQIDAKARTEFIRDVLERVELDGIRNHLVGTPGRSGLSNEQRKRLTIAVELVSNPSIIFMDEPTSGLDARAAAIVMRTVKNVADTGRTVLILMKKGGEIIYSGPLGQHSSNLIDYFKSIPGIPQIKENYNPATWMLEITTESVERQLGIDFGQVYEESKQFRDNIELVKELRTEPGQTRELHFATRFARNIWEQYKACLWKQNLSYWRNPDYNIKRLGFMTLASVAMGALMWQKGNQIYQGMLLVSISPDGTVASTLAGTTYALLNLFSGFLIPRPAIPKWWIWLYWITPSSWMLYGAITSQYGDNKEEITSFTKTEEIKSFLEDYYGYRNDFLGVVAVVVAIFPLLAAFLFAYFISKLNFQKR
ncbi:hypothetical protein AgCh_029351 [Apium graveolens]